MKVAINQTQPFGFNKSFIKKLFQTIARMLPRFAKSEISVAFVDNRTIKELNKQYRRHNKPTDVLSFAERDGDFINKGSRYLGEIIIAYPYARNQARIDNRSIREELVQLLIHGFLHLVGYDHMRLKERDLMKDYEKKIIDAFYSRGR